jgi:8-oxo-dGTP pyrophosphatase MutT (NUDIX family)
MFIVKDGLVLAVTRGKTNSEKIGLPGGKEEHGESPIETAIRETREETGIVITKAVQVHERIEPAGPEPDGEDFRTTAFFAEEWSGTPIASDEGEVIWVPVGKLTSYNTGAFPRYNLTTTIKVRRTYPDLYLDDSECIGGGFGGGSSDGGGSDDDY